MHCLIDLHALKHPLMAQIKLLCLEQRHHRKAPKRMYYDFYGLIGEPFRTTPDADGVYFSPSHREALSSILYGIKERKGVIVVTGEVGVGKTTILRRYLKVAEPLTQKTIHLYNPNITFEQLLITILTQLGAQPGGEASEMVRRLHELALAEQCRDGTVVLVIDEAQCLPLETLEGIRMLSNLETAHEKLVQIVLMGQPELDVILDRHDHVDTHRPELFQVARRRARRPIGDWSIASPTVPNATPRRAPARPTRPSSAGAIAASGSRPIAATAARPRSSSPAS